MEQSSNRAANLSALITGVTGNVGAACETTLLADTWFVHGLARRVAPVDTVSDNYATYDYKHESLDLNCSWSEMRLWCRSNHYQYDLVVLAHGAQIPATLHTMTEDQWQAIVYGNLSSCIGLTQALVKEDKLADDALLVYCSSIQANTPRAGRGLYAAAKAGLEAFSKTVAVELAPKRSIALRLGQLTKTMGGITFPDSEKQKLMQRALTPWVDPSDVAGLVLNLYWQKSMTGCVIDLDSGQGRNVW